MWKLIVLSISNIASIPLHRCKEMKSCRSCIGLQDPYCARTTDGGCVASDRGNEGIQTGYHDICNSEGIYATRRLHDHFICSLFLILFWHFCFLFTTNLSFIISTCLYIYFLFSYLSYIYIQQNIINFVIW